MSRDAGTLIFAPAPNVLMRRPELLDTRTNEMKRLSPGAVLAYSRLKQFAGKRGKAWPSMPTIANELGVSVRTARRYIAELEAKGLIVRKHRTGKVNHYSFVDAAIFKGEKRVLRTEKPAKEIYSLARENKTDLDPRPEVAADPCVCEVQTKTSQILDRAVSVNSAAVLIATAQGDIGLVRAVLWRLSHRRKPIRTISYIVTAINNHISDSHQRVLRSRPELSMPVAKPLTCVIGVPDFMEVAA